ncbi:unnamed protein product, partial [Staurois parvus]
QGLGQQAATYHWAGARATGGNLPLGRVLGQQGHWVHGDSTGSDGSSTQGHHRTRVVSAHTAGQFGTRVVGAHSGDSSGHEWSVHTPGTVPNTGGRCTQQAQFRTHVVSAHNRDSSGHGWSVHTAGTVQNTGGQCTQQEQFGHTGGQCA